MPCPHSRAVLTACFASLALTVPALADLWGTAVDPYGTGAAVDPTRYNKVYRFNSAGAKIEPDIDAGATGPIYPAGMAVAPNGNIYVSSVGNGSVMFYDGQSGAPLSLGANPPGLFATLGMAAPAQLAFGPDGNLYVSEFFGTNVRKYNPTTGEFLGNAATGLTSAGGLVFGPDGALYVGDGFVQGPGQSARVVRVYNGTQSTFGNTGLGILSSPTALQFLSTGDLLVADLLSNRIWKFDSTGFDFAQFAYVPPEIPDPLPPGVQVASNNPSDIDFDAEGNVLISVLGLTSPPDNRGAVLRYTVDGTPLTPLAGNLEPIGAIAWTPAASTSAGDFNADGNVDAADFAKWQADFGKWVAAGNGADGNGDGIVNAADFTVWRDKLAAPAQAAAVVPEPTASMLLTVGTLFLCSAIRTKTLSAA